MRSFISKKKIKSINLETESNHKEKNKNFYQSKNL